MLLISCLNWGSSQNFGAALYNVCPAAPSAKNNGTLQSYTMMNGGPGSSQFVTFNQTFGYDNANRLMSATDSGGWSRNFGYDAYGNMWVSAFTGITPSGNAPQNQNQFTGTNQITGNSYDAAGNLLSVNGNTAIYDAENRLVQVTEAPAYGGATESLAYDGSGHRVEKLVPSAMSVYVYDAFGALAASYSSAAATAACKTCYLSTDHLGSVRLVTDQNGTVIARHDYLPFGEEIPANTAGRNGPWGSTVDVVYKFTGKERDQETGLDYFGARYYGSALGRWVSPDPKAFSKRTLANPQKWNKYVYVLNNPLALFDPDGQEELTITVRAFIPEASFKFPAVIGPTWRGDGRSFSMAPDASHRAQAVLKIETDPARSATPLVGSPVTSTSGSAVNMYGLFTATANSDVKASVGFNFRMNDGTSVVGVSVKASDPLVPGAPSTSGTFTFNISPDGSNVSVNGSTSAYPAWEINVQNDSTGAQGNLLQYSPVGTSADSPGALLTGATNDISGSTTLPDKPQRQCSSQSGSSICQE